MRIVSQRLEELREILHQGFGFYEFERLESLLVQEVFSVILETKVTNEVDELGASPLRDNLFLRV